MKEMSLLYNLISEEYYFSLTPEPHKDKYRKTLSEKDLLGELRKNIDFKRKSLLNLLNLKEETITSISLVLKGSNVSIQRKIDKI